MMILSGSVQRAELRLNQPFVIQITYNEGVKRD